LEVIAVKVLASADLRELSLWQILPYRPKKSNALKYGGLTFSNVADSKRASKGLSKGYRMGRPGNPTSV